MSETDEKKAPQVEKKPPKGPWRLDCGCDDTGARCDREGILYASLEAARGRVIAAGFNPDGWAEAKMGDMNGSALADALFQARRAYHAHYAPRLRRFREGT